MQNETAIQLYLELLKKTILFEIWEEYERYLPGTLHISQNLPYEPITFPVAPEIKAYVEALNLDIVKKNFSKVDRTLGEDWPKAAHSMIGRLRINQLHNAMETIIKENIDGDFIETGVWRGGACIFMRGFLKAYELTNRKVWVADSFEGLPKPDIENYPQDKDDTLYQYDYLRVPLEEVQKNFKKYDLLDSQVQFLKGWFKDTLPSAPIGKIALARLDGDMYESTMDSLTNLYDKVSPGGFIIIDDFALPTCKAAIFDFREQNSIKAPLIPIDNLSVYWRKE
ncbi:MULTISPECIES: TylF/MycF family methyltransferase [Bacillus cereus group]|uniref:Class I SAM-dependent methyltransferase n=1 Tax=Bacillus proteolyticus TaxID=2026192 RepID=A0ABV3IDZ5_9BACI|nr:TylF/MycF family methyltransferase [Bacillus cereus group sp. N8]MBJ8104033.1 TylF/MycF family methyltransferase [Bacillus cereus group sp. N8]